MELCAERSTAWQRGPSKDLSRLERLVAAAHALVRPGLSGFDIYGLLVLVSVVFVSMRDLTTRALPVAVPTLMVTLVTAIEGGRYPEDFDAEEEFTASRLVAGVSLPPECARLAEQYRTMLRTLEIPGEWLLRYGLTSLES
jgi:hypothetical protein